MNTFESWFFASMVVFTFTYTVVDIVRRIDARDRRGSSQSGNPARVSYGRSHAHPIAPWNERRHT